MIYEEFTDFDDGPGVYEHGLSLVRSLKFFRTRITRI